MQSVTALQGSGSPVTFSIWKRRDPQTPTRLVLARAAVPSVASARGLPTPFTTHAHTVSSSEDMLSVASLLNFANDTVMIFQNEK